MIPSNTCQGYVSYLIISICQFFEGGKAMDKGSRVWAIVLFVLLAAAAVAIALLGRG